MMIGGAFRSIYIKFIMFAIAAITIIIFGLNILLPVDAGIDWQAIVFSSFFSVVGVIFFVYGLKVYSKKIFLLREFDR